MTHKDVKKIIPIGFFLMYAGFTLLLLPMIISAWPLSLTLSNTPQTFDFEDDLNSVSSTKGNPTIIASLSTSGDKAVECQNGDYLQWKLATPSKTIDLTFKTYWTKLPTIANEYLRIGGIYWSPKQNRSNTISAVIFYCYPDGYRGWRLTTYIPSYHSNPHDYFAYTLETNRWHTTRITADLNTGTYKMYMDETEIGSITDVTVPADVNVDYFRLGAESKGDSNFTTYYDDVTVSLLSPQPPPNQWSASITSSQGGSTSPLGTTNVNEGESLTVNTTPDEGYVFSKWTLDGTDYSTNSTVNLPPQLAGTTHTLHATFTETNPELNREYTWLPLQAIGLGMTLAGGYTLWPRKKQKSPHSTNN